MKPLHTQKFRQALICRAHQWSFCSKSGKGINPDHTQLARYPIKVENGEVLVQVEGVKPLYSAT